MIYARREAVFGKAEDAVSLDLIKRHCIVHHDEDDALLEHYRDAAIAHVEDATRQTILLSRYTVGLPCFERLITFRVSPVRALSQITYLDGDGQRQELDVTGYRFDAGSQHGKLEAIGKWPAATDVRCTMIVGFSDAIIGDEGSKGAESSECYYGIPISPARAMPSALRQAILLLVGHWYENREDVVIGTITSQVPRAVESLLFRYHNYRA